MRWLIPILLVPIATALLSLSSCSSTPQPAVELAELMLRMQVHAGKLHYAIEADNFELADFYVHELEESVETIAEARLSEAGVSLTKALDEYVAPAVTTLRDALKRRDSGAMRSGYERLLTGCNGCHDATRHGFITITKPRFPMFTNQQFEAR